MCTFICICKNLKRQPPARSIAAERGEMMDRKQQSDVKQIAFNKGLLPHDSTWDSDLLNPLFIIITPQAKRTLCIIVTPQAIGTLFIGFTPQAKGTSFPPQKHSIFLLLLLIG